MRKGRLRPWDEEENVDDKDDDYPDNSSNDDDIEGDSAVGVDDDDDDGDVKNSGHDSPFHIHFHGGLDIIMEIIAVHLVTTTNVLRYIFTFTLVSLGW